MKDSENFGGFDDRRVCSQHSGIDAKQTIFNWLLGILIASILGGTATIWTGFENMNSTLYAVKTEVAAINSDKKLNEMISQRFSERLSDVEHKIGSMKP